MSWLEGDGFDLQEINVDRLLAHAVLTIVPHHLKGEPYDESVLSILQKLLGEISLLHVVKMKEEILVVDVREDETVALSFIEELQSTCYSVVKILHVGVFIRIHVPPWTLKCIHILKIRQSARLKSLNMLHWREVT